MSFMNLFWGEGDFMNRIKLFFASTLLVSASIQLNGAATRPHRLMKNCLGANVIIFVHNTDANYEDTHTSEILEKVQKEIAKHPAIKNSLLIHEVDATKHDTSSESLSALKQAYQSAGAKVRIVYAESHELDFLNEIPEDQNHVDTTNRGLNIHEMKEDVQDVVKFANENSEQIHGALEGATALGDIIQKQSEENDALPPAQRRKWYQRAGACLCTAAQDPKVQEGVVDAAKLALQLAMMFA